MFQKAMQIIIVVQVQLPFIGEFDLPTKPLPLVLDFDQFSDVMYNATSVSLVRVLIPVKSHRAEDAMATPKMCCQKDTNLKQRGKSTFSIRLKTETFWEIHLAFSKPILSKASSIELMRGSSGSTNSTFLDSLSIIVNMAWPILTNSSILSMLDYLSDSLSINS